MSRISRARAGKGRGEERAIMKDIKIHREIGRKGERRNTQRNR